MTKIDISNNQFKGKLDAGNNMNINGFSDVEISITKSNVDGDAKLFNDLSINSGLKDDKKENEKDAVKKNLLDIIMVYICMMEQQRLSLEENLVDI